MTWHDIALPGDRMDSEDREFWEKVSKAFIRFVIGKEPPGCRLGTYYHEFDSGVANIKSVMAFGLWTDTYDHGKAEQYAEIAEHVLGIMDESIDWGAVAKISIKEELEERGHALEAVEVDPGLAFEDDD